MNADTVIPLLLVGVPMLVIWLWALFDAVRNPAFSLVARVAWLAGVLLLPGVGALLYVAIPGRDRLLAN
jgi:hypothetical protein